MKHYNTELTFLENYEQAARVRALADNGSETLANLAQAKATLAELEQAFAAYVAQYGKRI